MLQSTSPGYSSTMLVMRERRGFLSGKRWLCCSLARRWFLPCRRFGRMKMSRIRGLGRRRLCWVCLSFLMSGHLVMDVSPSTSSVFSSPAALRHLVSLLSLLSSLGWTFPNEAYPSTCYTTSCGTLSPTSRPRIPFHTSPTMTVSVHQHMEI